MELAKKVAELIKSKETRVEKNYFYGPPQVTLENDLLKNFVFELTMHASKEAYELFQYAYLIVENHQKLKLAISKLVILDSFLNKG